MFPSSVWISIAILFYTAPYYKVECANRSVHFKLVKDLMDAENDSLTLRPVNDTIETVKVGFRFAPVLTYLDEPKQELNVRGMYLLTWRDDRLSWDPADYDGIQEINLPLFKDGDAEPNIWKPELMLYESVGEGSQSFQPETQFVTVNYTGKVYWYTLATTKSYCTVIVRRYPFDTQICYMTFTTWLYQANEQLFRSVDDIIESASYKQYEIRSKIWNVTVDDIEVGNASYECISCRGEKQSYIRYSLRLFRNHKILYTLNLMLPSLVMSGMTLIAIYIPKQDVSSAAGFGVTCVLTFFVFLTYLFAQVPLNGLPLVGHYIVWLIIEAVVITTYTIYRARKEMKKLSNKKDLPATVDDTGETVPTKIKKACTCSAKNLDIVETGDISSEEDVDGDSLSKTSLKLTTLSKDGYNRVQGDAEGTSAQSTGGGLQVSVNGVPEEQKDDTELKLRFATSSREDQDESDRTTGNPPGRLHLFSRSTINNIPIRIQTVWRNSTPEQVLIFMKVVSTLFVMIIYFFDLIVSW